MSRKRKPESIEVGRQYRLGMLGCFAPGDVVIHVLRIEAGSNYRHVYFEVLEPEHHQEGEFLAYSSLYRRIWCEERTVMQ